MATGRTSLPFGSTSLFKVQQPADFTQQSVSQVVDPGSSIIPFLGPPQPFGGTPSASASTAPPAPTNTDPLSSLNIPIAQQGLPITSDYHNSLRDAVMAIARHLGITQVTSGAVVSFAPGFFQHLAEQAWSLDYGIAVKASNATSAKGWMPISLPDGARIQNMTVLGAKSGNFSTFDIKLMRQPFAATDTGKTNTLITISIKDIAAGPFTVTGQAAATDFSSQSDVIMRTAILDFKLIDNAKYKYLVTAEAAGDAAPASPPGSTAQIATIAIAIEL